MKIINNSVENASFIKMLVYGSSGAGKTVFGSTAPDVLFIDAEAGMLSIAAKNIDRVKIVSYPEISEIYSFLKAGGHKYKTVVIDSLTELQKKSMDAITAKSGNEKPSIGEWGANIEQIRNMVRAFRDLPMNVIFIALEQVEKDEISGTVMRAPGLQGKTLPAEVMGYVDIVGYMAATETADKKNAAVKTIIRMIRVQPGNNLHAKDRSGKLGVWVEPDFSKIYDKVFAPVEAPSNVTGNAPEAVPGVDLANNTGTPTKAPGNVTNGAGNGKKLGVK